jgi:2-polyprenyl-6-methoxyphenol hydroxylase-like FAD-dependent oxidoreductase
MGLMPAVLADRVDERGWVLVDARGRHMASMSAELFGGEGIVAEIEIARGDLARILFEASAGATYRFADRVVALTQDESGVDVEFASGDRDRFDIVVGADGVHSGVRALAFGPESSYVEHLGAYTSYFTVPDPGDLDHSYLMYNAPGGRVAGIRPERGGTAKASLSFRAPGDYHRLDRNAQMGLLKARLAGAGWKVPSLLAAMGEAPDFYFDSISRVSVPTWHSGRVVLLGDSGYCGSPLGGMGTSLSLVGAYVLAGELYAGGSPAEAFTEYQSQMAAYVADATQLPPGGVAGFAPNSALMIRMRAMSMRSMARWPMKKILEKQFRKAEAITLKPYASAPAGRVGPGEWLSVMGD